MTSLLLSSVAKQPCTAALVTLEKSICLRRMSYTREMWQPESASINKKYTTVQVLIFYKIDTLT